MITVITATTQGREELLAECKASVAAQTHPVAHHLVLPSGTLAIIYLALYSRLSRASMIEVDVSDEDMTDLGFIQSQSPNASPQSLQRGAWTRFDQSQLALRLDHIGGDEATRVLKK